MVFIIVNDKEYIILTYDIIPEYDFLFKHDNFKYNNPNINSIAYALSYWGYLYTEKETSNKTFFEESIGVIGINKDDKRSYMEDKTLITELGILRACKLSFQKLNMIERENNSLRQNFNYVYRIIIQQQEQCLKDFASTSLIHILMTFPLLNYLDNVNHEFFRTYFLLIKNKSLFTEKYSKLKYGEIFSKFEFAYGLTIHEYIEALYIIVMCKCEYNFKELKKSKTLDSFSLLFSLNQCNNEATKKKVQKALNMLSFNYNEAHKWSCDTEQSDLDFGLFQNKPLYRITNDLYAPVARKYMQDQIFNSLIYRIRSLDDENNRTFFNLLGNLFEEYVSYIFQKTINSISSGGHIISSFKYRIGKKEKASSDLFFVFDENVCVFELKSARPLNDIFCHKNKDAIEKSIQRLIKMPIRQSIERTKEIVFSNANIKLTADKNYYFVALTLGNFPKHYTDFSEIEDIAKDSALTTKGLFNMGIEEFELLCCAIEQGSKNIFEYLNEYQQLFNACSFKNYISKKIDKSVKIKCFNELENDLNKFIENIHL